MRPGFARLYARSTNDLHVVPRLEELDEQDFGGGFVEAAARQLHNQADAGSETARDALTLLFRLNAGVSAK